MSGRIKSLPSSPHLGPAPCLCGAGPEAGYLLLSILVQPQVFFFVFLFFFLVHRKEVITIYLQGSERAREAMGNTSPTCHLINAQSTPISFRHSSVTQQ